MKRNLLICILAGALVLIGSRFSYAIPFTNLQIYGGGSGITIDDDPNTNPGYSITVSQTVTFLPTLGSFNSAFLDITYDATNANEVWYALGSSDNGLPSTFTQLAQLDVFNPNHSDTQLDIDLNGVEPTIPSDGLSSWTLYMAFKETTGGNDTFTLYSTCVHGDYEEYPALPSDPVSEPAAPVPEPVTMLLLGSGLVGLVGFRKKFSK